MQKIQVNNKPIPRGKREEELKKHSLKKKFKNLTNLMEYIERLEERVVKLEQKLNSKGQ